MTPKQWLDETASRLEAAGIQSARLDAYVLLETMLQRDRASLTIDTETIIPTDVVDALEVQVNRRIAREPVAYIIGKREFFGLDFNITSDVLVPRPETEVIVERAILCPINGTVLDMGTGSGAIAVALGHHRPDLAIVASDVSMAALKVARNNAKTLNTSNVEFVESDLFTNIDQKFDAILANLPYVPDGDARQPEIKHEPSVALFSGNDGLDHYRRLATQYASHIKPGGILIIECEPTQKDTLAELFKPANINSLSNYVCLIEG